MAVCGLTTVNMDGQKRAAVKALPELSSVPKAMCPKNEALTRCR